MQTIIKNVKIISGYHDNSMRERERERERKAISHNFLRSSCILFNFFENNNELLEYNKWGTNDDGDDDSLIKQK